MNLAKLNPVNWGRGAKAATSAVMRANDGGPWAAELQNFVARSVSPRLYEALREALPVVDGAIGRLVTLDGIVRIEAESDRLLSQINDWADSVQVNDNQHGLQAYYQIQSNELYEQGFAVGEPVIGDGGKDLAALWVPDSKGVYFRRTGKGLETWYAKPAAENNTRRDGTEHVERLLRNSWATGSAVDLLTQYGYQQIKADMLDYAAIDVEANNPYGTSKIRSLEFVGRALATMMNATQQSWDRFGNPAFSLTYKRKRKPPIDDPNLATFQAALASNLASVLKIKQQGQSADFVNAIAADDELTLAIIGAGGDVLEIETPARFVLEQIIAKFGVPPWMLGMIWGTAERLADRQTDVALQDSKTRFAGRKQGLTRIVALALRARGVTWNAGDWEVVQELPNLKDEMAQAQANFLNTQAELMRSNAGRVPSVGGADNGQQDAPKGVVVNALGEIVFPASEFKGGGCGCGDHAGAKSSKQSRGSKAPSGENYVEDADELMRLEASAEQALLAEWDGLYADTCAALGIAPAKGAKAPTFTFNAATMADALATLEEEFVQAAAGEGSGFARAVFRAWLRGVVNGEAEFDADAIDQAARDAMKKALLASGLEQLRDTTVRAFRDDIVKALADGAYDGQNPVDVARALRQRFDAHGYDWERLARSEIAEAQATGKLSQYAAQDVERYDYVAAGNSCPVCLGLEAGGPYAVGAGPVPKRDSHPMCRCTVMAAVED